MPHAVRSRTSPPGQSHVAGHAAASGHTRHTGVEHGPRRSTVGVGGEATEDEQLRPPGQNELSVYATVTAVEHSSHTVNLAPLLLFTNYLPEFGKAGPLAELPRKALYRT